MSVASEETGYEPFEEKIKRLVAQLREHKAAARKLDVTIEASLKELG